MPPLSTREIAAQAIVARLEAIKGGAAYFYGDTLKGVERYRNAPNGTQPDVNSWSDSPKIVVRILDGTRESLTKDDAGAITLRAQCFFSLIGQVASDAEVSAALTDMKRALFFDFDTFLDPLKVFRVGYTEAPADEPDGGPVVGATLTLEFTCEDNLWE